MQPSIPEWGKARSAWIHQISNTQQDCLHDFGVRTHMGAKMLKLRIGIFTGSMLETSHPFAHF